jgi:hypothetical protein
MYTTNSSEPAEVHIKLCPCCKWPASIVIGRATAYIQCNNTKCGLATKGWPNIDKAKRAWNMRYMEVEAVQ